MSATILDSTFPARERPQEWHPPTTDLESTADLIEENTTDLAPVTADVPPAREPRAEDAQATSSTEPKSLDAARLERRAHEPKAAPAPASQTSPAPPVTEPVFRTEPQRPPALAPGAVLADRYLLEQVIGRGGTAIVYCARDMLSSTGAQPNTQVAIKTPRPELADRARASARLKHEFELAHRLSHPNIVRVFELHDDEQRCFMSMELIEGRLLSTLIRDWTMLSPPLSRKILRDCAQALAHAHSQGIVHGDFKPGNVFLTAQEEVKVLDFGAAASVNAEDHSRIHAGTPAYASPEVLSGQVPEQRDDVFSFACVAYELLTGQHPFERRSSLQARDEARVPQRAWSLSATQWLALLAALSWDRAQRPGDLDTLLDSLTAEGPNAAEAAPIHVSPEEAAAAELPADLMPPQRSWGFFIFIACALIVTLIASQRKFDTPPGTATLAPATTLPAPPSKTSAASMPSRPAEVISPAAAATTPVAGEKSEAAAAPAVAPGAASKKTKSAAAMSEISFESRSIVTSESSVSAVFLIKRSQPLSGRVRVSWNAISGTADAGIDFASNASGSVEFADGQAQRAIYVPLRNDLLKEGDETFTVRLHSPQQAKLGAVAKIEATIRDDD
jgi:serine/threonine protein kinase